MTYTVYKWHAWRGQNIVYTSTDELRLMAGDEDGAKREAEALLRGLSEWRTVSMINYQLCAIDDVGKQAPACEWVRIDTGEVWGFA